MDTSGAPPQESARVAAKKIKRPRSVLRIVSYICILIGGVVAVVTIIEGPFFGGPPVINSLPLDAWFYGSNTTFFQASTRASAESAIRGLGTNSFPFLLSVMKDNRGCGALYFKAYPLAPKWLQARLPSPIAKDDIRAMALQEVLQVRGLDPAQVQLLADRVAAFRNPRLRMSGFNLMVLKYQTDPAFLKLCRRFMDDPIPSLRLEAAIYLANSAVQSDPGDPRLFPILLAGLSDKDQRLAVADLRMYAWQRQPPGTPSASAAAAYRVRWTGGPENTGEGILQHEIKRALYRLERYLTPDQKTQFRQAMESQKPASP